MTRFDRVVVADWSAASQPSPARPTADAIWIGWQDGADTGCEYIRTRAAAERRLGDLITGAGRVLLGLDFALGYPAGFAARLTGQACARAVWRWFAQAITDGPDNRNNRFAVANAINARLGGQSGEAGPFWGRPASLPLPHLPATKAALPPGLAERRQTDTALPGTHPVWKLFTTGAVGSQVMMGLPMVQRLTERGDVAVWPFDPPNAARVVVAEVYPSILAQAVRDAGGLRDQAQVRLLARALWVLNQNGQLPTLFATPGPPVTTEEGWILGAGPGMADALRGALA